ncbi:hypothetical protein [Wolbachia endosymbiont (group A) of Pogonocherus hispidulus]
MLEKHYGSDHFQVAITLINLSNAYRNLGNTQNKRSCLNGL